MVNSALILILVTSAGLLLVGSVLPTPSTMVDVHVSTQASWHPLSGSWSMGSLEAETKESTFLNWAAVWDNIPGLSLTSQSLDVMFTLETQDGSRVLDAHTDKTGKGGVFGNTRTVDATFREIDPGTYHVRARILRADGATLAQATLPLNIVEAS